MIGHVDFSRHNTAVRGVSLGLCEFRAVLGGFKKKCLHGSEAWLHTLVSRPGWHFFLEPACARRGAGGEERPRESGRRLNQCLRIHETAVELVREGVIVARQIERHDPDLARQLRRALTSVPLNIAEGSVQTGKRRALHDRIAMGSAEEAKSAMMVADAAGYTGPIADHLSAAFRAVIGTLHRCVVPGPLSAIEAAARHTPRRPRSRSRDCRAII